jgi:hypothetical protein
MKLSKKQKAIIWAMVLIIVIALGMEGSVFRVESRYSLGNFSYYKEYNLYGIRLYVALMPPKAVPKGFKGVWAYYLLAHRKRPLIIATLLIGITGLLTIGKSGSKKGKKNQGLGA